MSSLADMKFAWLQLPLDRWTKTAKCFPSDETDKVASPALEFGRRYQSQAVHDQWKCVVALLFGPLPINIPH